MFKNYLYLFRAIRELKSVIVNKPVVEVYSQERDKLNLHIPSDENPYQTLILNTNSQFTFPQLRKEVRKAKRNTVNFIDNYIPAVITNLQIADDDRIIKLTTDKFNLYFTVWGGRSNVFFESKNEIICFKKCKEDEIFFNDKNFIGTDEPLNISFEDLSLENITDKMFFFRKDFKQELKYRMDNTNFTITEEVHKIITSVLVGKVAISKLDENQLKLHPVDFLIYKAAETIGVFDNLIDAMNFYISNYFKLKNTNSFKRELTVYLDKELGRLSSKLNGLRERIERGSNENKYRKFAELLLVNRHLLRKGQDEVSITDYESGDEIKIKVDPKLSVQQNIDHYYEKARDEKISYAKSKELYEKYLNLHSRLIEYRNKLENASEKDLEEMHSELIGNKKSKMQDKNNIRAKHYIAEGKYNIYVGKDNKSNDELTFKFAKQNDYWLHVRGYAGSHVVIRVDNPKEGIPKNIIKTAASLAAYHSKAKTAGLVPVNYTFRKYVRKSKGMAPGQVMIQKEQSVIVPPEIPSNCEYIDE